MTARTEQGGERGLVTEALRALGKRRLLLSIHDASFPGAQGPDGDADTGWGTPYGRGGQDFLRFVAGLGFGGVLLGPQGLTSRVNPSPYDGTIFSRNPLSIALLEVARDPLWGALLRPEQVEAVIAAAGGSAEGRERMTGRARYERAFDIQQRALREAFRGLSSLPEAARKEAQGRLTAFAAANAAWLEADARYCDEAPGRTVAEEAAAYYRFCQLLVHEQHGAMRRLAGELGLRLYGDLQIGLSPRDRWANKEALYPGYVMGAPPSRTNPDGQPWGYPILDPGRAAALALLRRRVGKLLGEFDGLRLDHPHGLICPWVYLDGRDGAADPLWAVQHGARLRSSPDLPDHPALAALSIAEPAQLDRRARRYDDGWVRALRPEQVERYGVFFDTVIDEARARGLPAGEVLCEVLSTYPYPIRRVVERHGLGRFRVTQKADLRDEADVYRSENAGAADWVMVGNHDTPPIWLVVERWAAEGTLGARAAYLARRLGRDDGERALLERRLAADPAAVAQAQLADLFVCPAENVLIFFADLFGLRQVYNVPGVVNDENWSLRLQAGYREAYERGRRAGRALDLPGALAMALRARGAGEELVPHLRRST